MDNSEFKNEDDLNPKHWKWGIFYYNKDDKRIFPPKRIKQMGYTVNFANPISILALIAILLLIFFIAKT